MLEARRILLIVAGGIAAYKSLDLIRRLRERGAAVRVVMTAAAQQFVTPLAAAALSGDRVYDDLFSLTDESEMGHLRLAQDADLVIVAPATADLLAKMAAGLADDLAATALLATDRPVLVAPAMNTRMWEHPATRDNLARLEARGVRRVGPGSGPLAEGESGMGRMAEPLEIVAAAEAILAGDGALEGRRALVTSGPTQEPIDPVRFIANRSSGKQGHAIAAALARSGAATVLVSGPTAEPDPPGVTVVRVGTAREMLAACERALPVDVAVCAAAVSDWRVEAAPQKLKKDAGPPLLQLVENPDILARLGARRESAAAPGRRLRGRDREPHRQRRRQAGPQETATGFSPTTSRRPAAPSAATATPFISSPPRASRIGRRCRSARSASASPAALPNISRARPRNDTRSPFRSKCCRTVRTCRFRLMRPRAAPARISPPRSRRRWCWRRAARALVPTGIALALPEGFEAQVRPRSGLALAKRRHRAQQPRHDRQRLSRRDRRDPRQSRQRERDHRARRTHRATGRGAGAASGVADGDEPAASGAGRRRLRLDRRLNRVLRLSKKLLFAIEAVLDIAYNAGTLPVQSGEITRRQGIPRRYLEQVLQQLVRAGVLAGVRGPRGGYRLARERRRISLGEIVRVVRTLDGGDDPLEEDAGAELGKQVVRPLWHELQDEVMKRLDDITIEDLCLRAHSAGVSGDYAARLDFSI